jgi:hypothetical protein
MGGVKARGALVYVAFGALFGFILSRSGATRFDYLHDMFTFRAFHMYGLIGTAVPVAMLGFALLRRARAAGRVRPDLRLPARRFHPGVVPGAAIFGAGWGLSGTCPAPAIVQVGEGHMLALATVAGILAGNVLYRAAHARLFSWRPEACG